MVVGKYTKTRKRRLRAKIVKSSHSKHYKKEPLLCTVKKKKNNDSEEEDRIENLKTKK